MYTNVITSLFRVGFGFALSVGLAIPMGLWMGMRIKPRLAFLPIINFFRNLSPLAWMPFAVTWFGIGDVSPIFLIFLAAFFPLVLATLAAVANIPSVYFRVAKDVGMSVSAQIWRVTMPAILPQIITALRVTAGLSWVVLVAAEMVAGAGGLGFAIWDDHNGLRPDLILVDMTMIGFIGIAIDILIQRMTKMPSVRWGYER